MKVRLEMPLVLLFQTPITVSNHFKRPCPRLLVPTCAKAKCYFTLVCLSFFSCWVPIQNLCMWPGISQCRRITRCHVSQVTLAETPIWRPLHPFLVFDICHSGSMWYPFSFIRWSRRCQNSKLRKWKLLTQYSYFFWKFSKIPLKDPLEPFKFIAHS